MYRLFIIPILMLIGCGQHPTLGIAPLTTYKPTLEKAGTLIYSPDAIQVTGLVGQFKLTLTNPNDEALFNTTLVVTVNDPNLISTISLARIYREIYWGGGLFNFPTPIQLPNNIQYPTDYTGYYTTIDADNLPPHTLISFDSIVLANPGLQMHFEVYASTSDGLYIVANHGTTVTFN